MKKSISKIDLKRVLNIILIILSVIYVCLITDVLVSNGYLPSHEDETINYNSGRLFYETGSLKAPVAIDEKVSPILGSNWYGFFFNLFYGGIAKIFGFSAKLYILINITFILFGFYILSKFEIKKSDKKYLAVVLLLIPNVVFYLFGYWPVIINLTLGIFLIYKLSQIHQKDSEGKNILKAKILYSLLCFLAIIVNPIWAIWVLGILPFYRDKKSLWANLFIVSGVVLSSFVYVKLFCAPWFAGSTTIVLKHLGKADFLQVFSVFTEKLSLNISYFFKQNLNFMREGQYDNGINQSIFIVLLFFSPAYYYFKKNKFYLATSFISLAVFFILISMYTAQFEFVNRLLTPIYVMLLFCVIKTDYRKIKVSILILLLLSFPYSLKKSILSINEHKRIYVESKEKYKSAINELEQIRFHVDPSKVATIQWVYYNYNMPKELFNTHLPMSDINKRPITYTTKINCTEPADCDTISDKRKFERYGRLDVNYALSKEKIVIPGYELVYYSENFKLYQIQKIKE